MTPTPPEEVRNSTTTTPPLSKGDATKTQQTLQEIEVDDARDISLALEESFRTLEREDQNANKTGKIVVDVVLFFGKSANYPLMQQNGPEKGFKIFSNRRNHSIRYAITLKAK